MAKPLRVLLVEDSLLHSEVIAEVLRRAGFLLKWEKVATRDEMAAALDREVWDVILSDHRLLDFGAAEALALVKRRGLDVPFIVVSRGMAEEEVVDILRQGARDCIDKENLARLAPVMARELREAERREAKARAEERIASMASLDRSTDRPEGAALRRTLEEAIRAARSEEAGLAVMLINLDNLREINDTLGYRKGDSLLKETVLRLASSLRESDTLARATGSEFAVVLSGGDAELATSTARAIVHDLGQTLHVDRLPMAIKVNIGIALCPQHGEDADALLQHAAVAMWEARRDRSDVVLYEPNRDPLSPQRRSLLGELQDAIEEDRLVLHYQAKVDFATGQVSGTEALVRWQHPTLGLLPPADFLPMAEESGLIRPLGQWVIHEALRQLHEWRKRGLAVSMAVNLSRLNLVDPELPDQLSALLREWDLAPSLVQLEIAEGAIRPELSSTTEVVENLRHLGVRVSIDNFGTGCSFLSHLQRLPVSELKIDRSLVLGMESNAGDVVLFQSLVDFGHDLGLKVVAGGVENQRIWDLVSPLRCDAAQGFHINPPLPGEELLPWLRHSRFLM